jgi:CRP-like cAMP-binding protein
MSLEQLRDRLKSVHLFRNLNDNLLKGLAEISHLETYKEGERIINEGDDSAEFFCILSGFVNITKNAQDSDKEIFMTTIGEGDCFGEAGAFVPLPRTANVTANSSVEAVRFQRKDFLNFMKNNPQGGLLICFDVIQQLFIRLRDTSKELEFERRTSASQDEIDEILKNL